jgi:hypothetical protein
MLSPVAVCDRRNLRIGHGRRNGPTLQRFVLKRAAEDRTKCDNCGNPASDMVNRLLRPTGLALLFVVLTALTQIGGGALLVGLAIGRMPSLRHAAPWARRAAVTLAALAVYGLMTAFLVPPLAKPMGRVRLPCGTDDGPVVAATWLTCALNRGYVRPDALALLTALGEEAGRRFSGSRLTTLEANFPFIDGFPLPPHLSHRDGRKVDLAYFYRSHDGDAAIAHGSPSWLGYFVYEQPAAGAPQPCAGRWTPLRWDFDRLQPRPPAWRLDDERTTWMMTWLKDNQQVARIFIEPHLAQRLDVAGGKVRFQGCHAARHDDHIHVELL